MPYFVVDREAMMIMRGPYKYEETAGAVRSEMERHRDDRNYWICRAKSIEDWYKANKEPSHAD